MNTENNRRTSQNFGADKMAAAYKKVFFVQKFIPKNGLKIVIENLIPAVII